MVHCVVTNVRKSDIFPQSTVSVKSRPMYRISDSDCFRCRQLFASAAPAGPGRVNEFMGHARTKVVIHFYRKLLIRQSVKTKQVTVGNSIVRLSYRSN